MAGGDIRALYELGRFRESFEAVESALSVAQLLQDGGYHTYQEWVDESAAIVAAHPSLVTRTQIGTSYEGRPIWALKVSDNAATDEDEPEIFINGLTHARYAFVAVKRTRS